MEKPFYRVTIEPVPHVGSDAVLWYVVGWSTPQEKKLLAVCPTKSMAENVREAMIRRRALGLALPENVVDVAM
jgi:hypothetical protein